MLVPVLRSQLARDGLCFWPVKKNTGSIRTIAAEKPIVKNVRPHQGGRYLDLAL